MSFRNRFESYFNYATGKTISGNPFRIIIEITNSCNLKCTMCSRAAMTRKIEHMDIMLFEKILKENHLWLEFVSLNGIGEPLLHPELFDFIALCKRYNVPVGISTNCTLLNEDKARMLLKAKPELIIFAIDGATKDVYERVRCGANFESVTDNLKNYLNMRKKENNYASFTVIQCISMTETRNQISTFHRYFNKYEYDAIRIRQLTYTGHERKDADYKNLSCPCYWLWMEPMIHSNGTVVPCCQDVNGELVLGNIKDNSLCNLWNSEVLKKIRSMHKNMQRSSIPICNSCNMYQPNQVFAFGAIFFNTSRINRIIPKIETLISLIRYR